MKKVIIMVGVPRSGKTTWVERFVDSIGEDKCKVLSYDTIRANLYGSKANQGDFKTVQFVFNYGLAKAFKDEDYEYIIIDNTNVKKEYRDNLIAKIKEEDSDALIFFKEIKTSKLLTYVRALYTRFPLSVLNRMYKNYDNLTREEQLKKLV